MFEFTFDDAELFDIDCLLEMPVEVNGEVLPDWVCLGEDVWALDLKGRNQGRLSTEMTGDKVCTYR